MESQEPVHDKIKKLPDEPVVFTMPADQPEEHFIELYKKSSGMRIKYIPISEKSLYELAKTRALESNETHPEVQRVFIDNSDYHLRFYKYDEKQDDFILDPVVYKMRLFTIPKSLDIGSF
jgi:hypothetical protein